MDDIFITVKPVEAINITIERLQIIHISENEQYDTVPDFLSIYKQAKEKELSYG